MKRLKNWAVVMISVAIITAVYSCKEETDDPEPAAKTTYNGAAKAILDGSCATAYCHASGAQVGSLEGYADAKTFAEFGRILGAIKHEAGFSAMPKNGAKMSDADIATIEAWISDELLEN